MRPFPSCCRSTLVPLLLALIAPPLAAQSGRQSVTGIVRDGAEVPLPGAEVTVGTQHVVTDTRGTFHVDSLRAGQYPLLVRLLGYAPVYSRVVVVDSEPTHVELYLARAAVRLAPLIVEGHRGGISGTVGDTAYHIADGARVQLLGPHRREARTDSLGKFSFPDANDGQYVVRVTYPGYSERRISVEIRDGQGRELAVLLTPTGEPVSFRDEGPLQDLGARLAFSAKRSVLSATQMAAANAQNVCDVPQLRSEVGDPLTLILNGNIVYADWPLSGLCSWRVDEVELLEFGNDICGDATHSLAALTGINCFVKARNAPRSIRPGGSTASTSRVPYVVIWEKK